MIFLYISGHVMQFLAENIFRKFTRTSTFMKIGLYEAPIYRRLHKTPRVCVEHTLYLLGKKAQTVHMYVYKAPQGSLRIKSPSMGSS